MIKSNWQQNLKSMHKMPTFKRKTVALVVLAFYFLVLEQQTQDTRFLRTYFCSTWRNRGESNWFCNWIVLQKTRHVRRARSWSRKQFWFETLLHWNFVEELWKENFRISGCTFKYIVQVVCPDLAKNGCKMSLFFVWLIRRKMHRKQLLLKTWLWKCNQMRLTSGCGILSNRKQIIYIIHLDLGFQHKPCLITGQIKLLPWLTFSGSVHRGISWCLHTKNIYLLVGK